MTGKMNIQGAPSFGEGQDVWCWAIVRTVKGDTVTLRNCWGVDEGWGRRLEGGKLEWRALDSDIRVGVRSCVAWCELLDWDGRGAHSGSMPEWLPMAWDLALDVDIQLLSSAPQWSARHQPKEGQFYLARGSREGSFHGGGEAEKDISGHRCSQKETEVLMLHLPSPFLLAGPTVCRAGSPAFRAALPPQPPQ